jgi:hypothetical protein
MNLQDEIEFLLKASKDFASKEKNKDKEFIEEVVAKLYKSDTISDEAYTMAKKLFPTKQKIVDNTIEALLAPSKSKAKPRSASRAYTPSSYGGCGASPTRGGC